MGIAGPLKHWLPVAKAREVPRKSERRPEVGAGAGATLSWLRLPASAYRFQVPLIT